MKTAPTPAKSTTKQPYSSEKSQRARDVEEWPVDPRKLAVAGDERTPAGKRYTDSYGNDYRQHGHMPWTEQHERQVELLLSSARPKRVPIRTAEGLDYAVINWPYEDPVRVHLQSLPGKVEGAWSDEGGYFDVLTDDGRQRRRDAIVANQRLKWISDRFVKSLWTETSAETERKERLRERLLDYGALKHAEENDLLTYPPPADDRDLAVGDAIAPWLQPSFITALLDGRSAWFHADIGEAIAMNLRADVVGEDVPITSDWTILANNYRSGTARVPTPLASEALVFKRLLEARGADGQLVHNSQRALALYLGVEPEKVGRAIRYTEICPRVKEAVDRERGGVSLALAVAGRECICFGYNKDGSLGLLPVVLQDRIFDELMRAFRIEADDEGVGDSRAVRAILRTIKARELTGTQWAEGVVSPRRASAAEKAAAAAAKRVGMGFDKVSRLPVEKVAAAVDVKTAEPSEKVVAAVPVQAAPIAQQIAHATRSVAIITPHITLKHLAKLHGDLLDARGATSAERTQFSAVAAVLGWLSGDTAALDGDGFAALRKSLGIVAVPVAAAATVMATITKPTSPFAREAAARTAAEQALTLWEAEVGDGNASASSCAEVVRGAKGKLTEVEDIDGDCVQAASRLLDRAGDSFGEEDERRHDHPVVHVREEVMGLERE